jgi:hypothetical protein
MDRDFPTGTSGAVSFSATTNACRHAMPKILKGLSLDAGIGGAARVDGEDTRGFCFGQSIKVRDS